MDGQPKDQDGILVATIAVLYLWAVAVLGLWFDKVSEDWLPIVTAVVVSLPASAFIFLTLRWLNRRDTRHPPDAP